MIILMGLAGSGKSTQGQILAEKTGLKWLSTGEVLRNTPNEEVHAYQRRGELVPDEIIIPLMAKVMTELSAKGEDVVLDGYPRTADQAEWIAENVADKVEVVLRVQVPKEELVRRLQLRGRVDDQTPEAIEARLQVVEQNLYSVCRILEGKQIKIVDIDGVGTVEEVAERIDAAVKAIEADRVGLNK